MREGKVRKDKVTEMEFGEGAIRTVGKFLIQEASTSGENPVYPGRRMTLVCGIVVEPLLSKEKHNNADYKFEEEEMWEGEIILIPKRKYIDNKVENRRGLRIDQKLLGSWGQSECWKKKIFDKEKGK